MKYIVKNHNSDIGLFEDAAEAIILAISEAETHIDTSTRQFIIETISKDLRMRRSYASDILDLMTHAGMIEKI